jgi:hypothetical protein
MLVMMACLLRCHNYDRLKGKMNAPVDGTSRMDCDCRIWWHKTETGQYCITSFDLTHSAACISSRPPAPDTNVLDSQLKVTEHVKADVKRLIKAGATTSLLRDILKSSHDFDHVDDGILKKLIMTIKTELGWGQQQMEIQTLMSFCNETIRSVGGHYEVHVDEECVTDRLFFMVPSMIENFQRIGQCIIVDATYQTNRYKLALVLVTGVNENYNSVVLAFGLVRHEDGPSYDWFFNNMKRSVGDAAWSQLKVVSTDGEGAFNHMFDSGAIFGGCTHVRCRWHIHMNMMKHVVPAITKAGGNKSDWNVFLTDWCAIEQSCTESQCAERWQAFIQKWHMCSEYLSNEIYPNLKKCVDVYINKCCHLGCTSTQRAEGMNNVVKRSGASTSYTLNRLVQEVIKMEHSKERSIQHERDKHSRSVLSNTDAQGIQGQLERLGVSRYAASQCQTQLLLATSDRGWDFVKLAEGVMRVKSAKHPDGFLVTVTPSSIECECQYPSTFLLPCRHVILCNMFGFPAFSLNSVPLSQIHSRWYVPVKPRVEEAPRSDVAANFTEANSESAVSISLAPRYNVPDIHRRSRLSALAKSIVDASPHMAVNEYNDLYHDWLQKDNKFKRVTAAELKRKRAEKEPTLINPFHNGAESVEDQKYAQALLADLEMKSEDMPPSVLAIKDPRLPASHRSGAPERIANPYRKRPAKKPRLTHKLPPPARTDAQIASTHKVSVRAAILAAAIQRARKQKLSECS